MFLTSITGRDRSKMLTIYAKFLTMSDFAVYHINYFNSKSECCLIEYKDKYVIRINQDGTLCILLKGWANKALPSCEYFLNDLDSEFKEYVLFNIDNIQNFFKDDPSHHRYDRKTKENI